MPYKDKEKQKEYLRAYLKEYRKTHRASIDLVKKAVYRKKYNATHKEKRAIDRKRYYAKNKERIIEKQKEYRKHSKNWLKDCHKIKKNNKRNERRRTDISYVINCRMSYMVYDSLRQNKNGRKWEELVGYNLGQLKRHLEKQFKKGMTWENILKGEIHIDHKIPVSVFNITSYDCIDFKRCWALSNLQPMWAIDNLKKSNKLDKPFQPALQIMI
jgi:hypothetical protein